MILMKLVSRPVSASRICKRYLKSSFSSYFELTDWVVGVHVVGRQELWRQRRLADAGSSEHRHPVLLRRARSPDLLFTQPGGFVESGLQLVFEDGEGPAAAGGSRGSPEGKVDAMRLQVERFYKLNDFTSWTILQVEWIHKLS